MKYLIHYVRHVSSIILCKLTILFSTAALKSEPKIFQINHRFKIWIFECCSYTVLPSFLQFTKRFWNF